MSQVASGEVEGGGTLCDSLCHTMRFVLFSLKLFYFLLVEVGRAKGGCKGT